MIKIAEATPITITTNIDNDFKVTPEQIEAVITPKTRMIWFSTPCNPSGSVYTKEELKAIADVIVKYPNILIVSDEIYEHINFLSKHESIAQFDFIKDQVITVNGVSKGFAMTGWRIGYIGAPKWIADGCVKMQGQFTSGTCSIAQKAAQAAQAAKKELASNLEQINGVNTFIGELPLDTGAIKDIAFQLKAENAPFFGVFASRTGGKPTISVAISDDVVREKGLNAGAIIREIAVHIKGGGGGQPFFATAGGKDESGIPTALDAAKKLV